jgi:hypothetical protein
MVAFRCYESKSHGIHRWLANQLPEIQAEVSGALELLQAEREFSGICSVKPLRGKCKGLTEIKVDFPLGKAAIHIRILGYEGPRNGEFTLLLLFIKKGGPDYGPACRSAHNRKRGVEKDERRTQPCRFP